jgi:hypothetical protein
MTTVMVAGKVTLEETKSGVGLGAGVCVEMMSAVLLTDWMVPLMAMLPVGGGGSGMLEASDLRYGTSAGPPDKRLSKSVPDGAGTGLPMVPGPNVGVGREGAVAGGVIGVLDPPPPPPHAASSATTSTLRTTSRKRSMEDLLR